MDWATVAVVAIVIWGVVKAVQAKHGIVSDEDGNEARIAPADRYDDSATKAEIKQLKERVQVLERLVTDRSHTLADEIELEGMWGQSLKPGMGEQANQRITLLTQENAELRAELGAVKDRLGNVERIVTDGGYGLTQEIENLRAKASDPADSGVPINMSKQERA